LRARRYRLHDMCRSLSVVLTSITIAVAAEEIVAMRELLRDLAAVKADAAARRQDDESEPVMAALEDLLAQSHAPVPPTSPVELTGPVGVIRDAAYGLLLDGVDALAEVCRTYEAGRASLPELVSAGESAVRRLELLRSIEERDGWSEC
jgi:hypothetical protein